MFLNICVTQAVQFKVTQHNPRAGLLLVKVILASHNVVIWLCLTLTHLLLLSSSSDLTIALTALGMLLLALAVATVTWKQCQRNSEYPHGAWWCEWMMWELYVWAVSTPSHRRFTGSRRARRGLTALSRWCSHTTALPVSPYRGPPAWHRSQRGPEEQADGTAAYTLFTLPRGWGSLSVTVSQCQSNFSTNMSWPTKQRAVEKKRTCSDCGGVVV